ncbi:MAG: hypothetical protein ACR2LJ_08485 [Acidimicrobiales bacterium]
MRKILLLLLVIVVGLLIAADVAARRTVEAQLESRIRVAVASADGVPPDAVTVHVDSVPFLARLAFTGNVSGVRASVAGVAVEGLRFSRVAVDLRDVHIDRDRLVLHRQVDIKTIGHGMAVGEVTQADLRRALDGVPIVLGDGTIGVTVAGVRASVSAAVVNGVLRLSAGGIRLPAITLPKTPLLPCVSQAASVPGRLVLSCAVDQVPREILRRAAPPSTGARASRPAATG